MIQIEQCAKRLFALGDEDRLRIVLLLRNGPLNVSKIAQETGLAPSTASHHLKILEGAGLVQVQRRGNQVLNRLHPDVFTEANRLDLGCCTLQFRDAAGQ
jgi:DNA-binding transcriptional ArsR family regulator